MTSTKPYLIRALYEWIVDNSFTPHLLVDARDERCVVPRQFVKDGAIVLNIAQSATNSLMMGQDTVSFGARFSGVAYSITVPVAAVRAIYARENGRGLAFEDEPEPADTESTSPPAADKPPTKRAPTLTIVK
ncbi:MAG: ClpXP protease specificity-enhancing factor [Gammaproteobacteria bacterium]|nr:ClpXP protease specificity-enhancing factor [Gammaproteobacteria bacterium]